MGNQRRIFVTGTAGFIGFHLAKLLLEEGFEVCGFDGFTDYYDVKLKHRRNEILRGYSSYQDVEAQLEDEDAVNRITQEFKPQVIVHLAAQAGVRYSLENPRAYLNSNLVGSFNIMEAARTLEVDHLLMASTSSVYGSTTEMPFHEHQKVDTPLTFYAATKKANEAMGHSYAHIHDLPITMFRFFTVYGPWGRPDMAPIKFAKGISTGEPIDIYNHGDMYRDFTYVEDLVRGIRLLIDAVPPSPSSTVERDPKDSLSDAAPFRVVNIGNSEKVRLLDFIEALEEDLGKKAVRNYMPMQLGDVPATWADAELLKNLTGYQPTTSMRQGVSQFVDWYKEYYLTD
nr:GDP-mannose 4,6-dehydratase [uncultured Shimia sp.]